MLFFLVFATQQSRSSLPARSSFLPRSHSSLFVSEDCALFSATALSQPLAYETLPHSFHRDGGCTPYRHRLPRSRRGDENPVTAIPFVPCAFTRFLREESAFTKTRGVGVFSGKTFQEVLEVSLAKLLQEELEVRFLSSPPSIQSSRTRECALRPSAIGRSPRRAATGGPRRNWPCAATAPCPAGAARPPHSTQSGMASRKPFRVGLAKPAHPRAGSRLPPPAWEFASPPCPPGGPPSPRRKLRPPAIPRAAIRSWTLAGN